MRYATIADYRGAWDLSPEIDPAVPLNLDLELCSLCSLRCPFCYWGEDRFQEDMKAIDWDYGPMKRTMLTGFAMRLIDEAADIGIPAMKFHGRGDGIHHPEYSRVLLYARAKNKFLDLQVNTHGCAGEDKIAGLMAADKIMISLDSTIEARYKRMRVGGDFAKVLKMVRELLKVGHKNVWVRRVITKENRTEPFVDNCKHLFGDKVHVSEHFAFPGRNEAYNGAVEKVEGWDRTYCQYPSVRLLATASGLALPCCVDWRQEMVVGNFKEQSILEIWNGDKLRNLRAELRRNEFKSAICQNCTSFQSFKRPERKYVSDHEGVANLG